MKIARKSATPPAPGTSGTARVDRNPRQLLGRVRPGDVAVIDHLDLDRATAQALVDAGVAVVVNASPMISGRFASRGPEVLTTAGVEVVENAGSDVLALSDGTTVRVDGGEIHDGETLVATGTVIGLDQVREQMQAARSALPVQLETFAHNSAALLRREEELLLHGQGLPALRTRLAGRPVVVVAPGDQVAEELRSVRAFVREQHPVLVGVDSGADALLAARLRPDVVVLQARAGGDGPSTRALKQARDVVVRLDPGAGREATEHLERLGVRALRVETGVTPEDVALLLADAAEASVVVGVGMHAALEEFLDSRRTGLASTYLTRLRVGPRLVDATALPTLYSGRVRPRHLLLLLLAGFVALVAALAVTPVGGEWVESALDACRHLVDQIQGKFS